MKNKDLQVINIREYYVVGAPVCWTRPRVCCDAKKSQVSKASDDVIQYADEISASTIYEAYPTKGTVKLFTSQADALLYALGKRTEKYPDVINQPIIYQVNPIDSVDEKTSSIEVVKLELIQAVLKIQDYFLCDPHTNKYKEFPSLSLSKLERRYEREKQQNCAIRALKVGGLFALGAIIWAAKNLSITVEYTKNSSSNSLGN